MRFEITQRDIFQGATVRKGTTVEVTREKDYSPKSMRPVDAKEKFPWAKPAKKPSKKAAPKAAETAPLTAE